MQLIFIVISSFLMAFSCNNGQGEDKIQYIIFNTLARSGEYEEIKISADSIQITFEQRRSGGDKEQYGKAIEKEAWMSLVSKIRDLDVEQVKTMESPTMARAYDGARHSEITIVTFNNGKISHSFDDENPHKELQPLMQEIRKLANMVWK